MTNVIQTNLNTLTQRGLKNLRSLIRDFSEDGTIQIIDIRSGSVILTLEGTWQGTARLYQLYTQKQLEFIGPYRVLSVAWVYRSSLPTGRASVFLWLAWLWTYIAEQFSRLTSHLVILTKLPRWAVSLSIILSIGGLAGATQRLLPKAIEVVVVLVQQLGSHLEGWQGEAPKRPGGHSPRRRSPHDLGADPEAPVALPPVLLADLGMPRCTILLDCSSGSPPDMEPPKLQDLLPRHDRPDMALADCPPDEVVKAALAKSTQEYYRDDFMESLLTAREVRNCTPAAWKHIGRAACRLGQAKWAIEAYNHADGNGRKTIQWICEQNNIVVDGSNKPPAPPLPQTSSDSKTQYSDYVDTQLSLAQSEYVNGNYHQAIALARAVMRGSPVRAWRIIGSAACNIKDLKLVNDAYRRLDAPGRQYLAYVCQRNGIQNSGSAFKLAEP